jgi:hypothetical protein
MENMASNKKLLRNMDVGVVQFTFQRMLLNLMLTALLLKVERDS